MAGTFVNRTFPEVVGLVPTGPDAGATASHGARAIGGAPPPLLLTGQGQGETFLDRAVATLREAGIQRILVEVTQTSGPVAARARRAGAELLHPPGGAGAMDPESVVAILPPAFPLVQPETLVALLSVLSPDPGAPMAWPAGMARIEPCLDPPPTGAPGVEVGPCLVRGLQSSEAEGVLQVPVHDPGIHLRVDTLSAYRRHFPAAYRRRFQKW